MKTVDDFDEFYKETRVEPLVQMEAERNLKQIFLTGIHSLRLYV